MSLIQKVKAFYPCFLTVSALFWRMSGGVSYGVVVFSIISKVSSIIAFLLPLKVVLLASSKGVPRYFQGFIDDGNKDQWIASMAVAAFIFYALSLVSDLLCERSSQRVAGEVANNEGHLAVCLDNIEKVKAYFKSLGQVWAEMFFAGICFLGLFFLDTTLALGVILVIILEIFLSNILVKIYLKGRKAGLAKYMIEDTSAYLKVLASINFLVGFCIILTPYLMGYPANILASIICIILLRQSLNSLVALINNSLRISKEEDIVKPLIFDDVVARETELPRSIELREILNESERERWLQKEMGDLIPIGESIQVEWMDPLFRDYNMFRVTTETQFSGGIRDIQLQVLGHSWKNVISKESVLFRCVEREKIFAPRQIKSFEVGGFGCQIFDFEGAQLVDRAKWNDVEQHLILEHWCYSPPSELIRTSLQIGKLFWQRFSADMLSRLKMASTNSEQAAAIDSIIANIDRIVEFLTSHPFYIYNPDLQPSCTFRSSVSGRYVVPIWGRWALEPIGFKLPSGLNDEVLQDYVNAVNGNRDDIETPLIVTHVKFVNLLSQLEYFTKWQKYAAALSCVDQILANSFFISLKNDLVCA